MKASRLYQGVLTLLVGLFILLQTSAIAHATQYGEAVHEHDGQVCVLDAVTEEADAGLLDTVLPIKDFRPFTTHFETAFVSLSYLTPPGRAPPPRSPPLTIL